MEAAEVREIYRRDGCSCQYCGFDGRSFDGWRNLSLDHVIPTTAGGPDTLANIVVACGACNSAKGNRRFASFTEAKAWVMAQREGQRPTWQRDCLAHTRGPA